MTEQEARFYSGQQGPPTPVESVQEAEARRLGPLTPYEARQAWERLAPWTLEYRAFLALSKAEQEREAEVEQLHWECARWDAVVQRLTAQVRDLREALEFARSDLFHGNPGRAERRIVAALQATQEDG